MAKNKESAISRREFAKRAAMVSAAATLAPANLIRAQEPAAPPSSQPVSAPTKLSPESQAEVDSRIQSILAQYGSRLSDVQKADVRRLATEAQPPLDRLRAYATDNGDGPALYLRPLIEWEKKPPAKSSTPATANAPKKS
jgi:hypothetical protein